MALTDFHFAFIKLGDSRKRTTEVRIRVRSTDANAYWAAATQILKDGTSVGQLLLSIEDLSKCTMMGKGVQLVTEDDAATFPLPNSDVYIFDKLGVSYTAGFDSYQITIPGRDTASYQVADDGVTVLSNAPQQVVDFISRFNAVALAKNGQAPTISKLLVVS